MIIKVEYGMFMPYVKGSTFTIIVSSYENLEKELYEYLCAIRPHFKQYQMENRFKTLNLKKDDTYKFLLFIIDTWKIEVTFPEYIEGIYHEKEKTK